MTWWMWLLIVLGLVAIGYAAWINRFEGGPTLMAFLIVGVVLAAAIGIPLAIQDQNRWEAWCRSQGGHVVKDTDVVNTVTVVNGQPGVGVGVTTDYFCLSADGRVLGMHS